MMLIKKLLVLLTLTLTACACTSLSVPVQCPQVPSQKPVQTEQAGFFQSEWIKALETFKTQQPDSSGAATN